MPTPIVRVTASPRVIATGNVEVIRFAGGGDRAAYRFGGVDYRAGLAQIPKFAAELGFNENGWTGGISPTTGTLTWHPTTGLDALANNYLWSDGTILIELGLEDDAGNAPSTWTTLLSGNIAQMESSGGAIQLTVADISDRLDKPMLAGRFAGTGGVEGPLAAANRVKRKNFGYVYNVEGRILDPANSVYEFGDPAGQFHSFDALRDMGRAASPAPTVLAWQGSIAATFAALQAATCVQGSGVVAPSISCAKWWTTPVGPLTADIFADVGGGSAKPAHIAERILNSFGGLSIDAPSLAAAVAARPELAGLHVGDETMSWASAVDRVLLGSSLAWVLQSGNLVVFRPIAFANSAAQLVAESVSREAVLPPIKTRRLGYQRNERQHQDGEIASSLLVADVAGLGDLAVLDAVDYGTQVVGPTRPENNATVGADANSNIIDSGNAGGTITLPRNEVRTSLGTSADFTGRGTLARLNSADWGTHLTGRPAVLTDVYANGRLKSENVGYADFTAVGDWKPQEAGANITENRTASDFSGRGVLARLNAASLDTHITDGTTYKRFALTEQTKLSGVEAGATIGAYFGGNLRETSGGTLATVAGYRTADGTAADFAGRGTLARLNSADSGTNVGNRPAALTNLRPADQRILADSVAWSTVVGDGLEALRPGEFGANVTETRTASDFSGRGTLARLNAASMDSHVTDGSTYIRPLAAHFTSGQPKLQIAASGTRLGGVKNTPVIMGASVGFKFTGSLTFTANSSGGCTISCSAGLFKLGSTSVSIPALSVNDGGSPGQTSVFHLFVSNADYLNSGYSMQSTTNGDALYEDDSRMYLGSVRIDFPTTGSTSGEGAESTRSGPRESVNGQLIP